MRLFKKDFSVCGALALALHLLWLIIIGHLIWVHFDNNASSPPPSIPRKLFEQCQKCGPISDGIAYANQIGRLDIIALILTLVTVILGFVAIGGFWLVRASAREAARDEARDIIGPIAREQVAAKIDSDEFRKEVVELVRQGITDAQIQQAVNNHFTTRPVQPGEANDIAEGA